jgi:hypothetical protein
LDHPIIHAIRILDITRNDHSFGGEWSRLIPELGATPTILPKLRITSYNSSMLRASGEAKHAQLVERAVEWLRHTYRCGIILSEQSCAGGEVPDVIGWKGFCQSVLVECKVSRGDFLADANKPFRLKPEEGLGSRRFYMAPAGLIGREELPRHWGLLECKGRQVQMSVKAGKQDLRSPLGIKKEMNLLLASLRRVEVRIEPQTITEFLKWKNRLADYNGGCLPDGIVAPEEEQNGYLVT